MTYCMEFTCSNMECYRNVKHIPTNKLDMFETEGLPISYANFRATDLCIGYIRDDSSKQLSFDFGNFK